MRETMGETMGVKREKGKIPHDEWPKILARYNGGETIASIGRAYGCTAPAIRYIVKRSGMLKDEASGRRVPSGSKDSVPQHAVPLDVLSPAGPKLALPHASALPLGSARSGRAKEAQALGPELRRRVSGDIASFLVALDQAVLDRSPQFLFNLQEATDRLMRSTARTRIELERLLSAYEGVEMDEDAWRERVSGRQRDA